MRNWEHVHDYHFTQVFDRDYSDAVALAYQPNDGTVTIEVTGDSHQSRSRPTGHRKPDQAAAVRAAPAEGNDHNDHREPVSPMPAYNITLAVEGEPDLVEDYNKAADKRDDKADTADKLVYALIRLVQEHGFTASEVRITEFVGEWSSSDFDDMEQGLRATE